MPRTGRPRTAERIRQKCLECGKEYERAVYEKGRRRFCSKECYWASKKGTTPAGFVDTAGVRFPRIEHVTKPCKECGKEFWVKGASRRERQIYCSADCAGLFKHPEPKELTPTQAAYLAGFFDGEGNIQETRRGVWRVTIYQCNEEVIRWIAEVTGTGLVASRVPRGDNLVKKSQFKTGWIWQLYGRNAALFIFQIIPYMRVKHDLAEVMLSDYDLTLEEILFHPAKMPTIVWE